jgi:hypothetical protein
MRWGGWALGLAILAIGLAVGCGDKEPQRTAPRRERQPPPERRPAGPPKKLMPPELKAKVDQEFKLRTGEIERCYNDYVVATDNKNLRGTIIIAVRIGWKKHPTKVWFLRNDFKKYPNLTECFLEKIRKWEFPTWGGVMDYSFPKLILEEM